MNTQVRYVLKGVLEYHHSSGDSRKAEFLTLNAPKGKHSRHVARLRQAVMTAGADSEERIAKLSSEAIAAAIEADTEASPEISTEATTDGGEAEPDDTTDGLWVVNMIARSSVDLGEFYGAARDLFTQKGVVLVDDNVSLTGTLLDNMSAADFEGMVGDYVLAFTLPS